MYEVSCYREGFGLTNLLHTCTLPVPCPLVNLVKHFMTDVTRPLVPANRDDHMSEHVGACRTDVGSDCHINGITAPGTNQLPATLARPVKNTLYKCKM